MRTFRNSLFALLALVLFFTACEQDQLETVAPVVKENQKPMAITDLATTPKDAVDLIEIDDTNLESRGTKVLVYSSTGSVTAAGWKHFWYTKSALAGYRYTAVITPTGGDPDLYIYGYDTGNASPWRYVRRSANAGEDSAHLAGSDLNLDEEYGAFSVYGFTASTFKIRIYREEICKMEDCLSINTSAVKAVKEGSRYLITDGRSRMFMAPNSNEAKMIVRVFSHYGINQSCFVGRPGASFFYLNKDGNAPEGSMPGEDCIGFNPDNIEVKQIGGRWKIVEGNHWIFDFDTKEDEARQAFCIIKKYGFTKSCYVGRPGPSLEYLRK
ncbi:MAG: hypothetical protein AAGI23_04450 [Bacteroidota bacterium]